MIEDDSFWDISQWGEPLFEGIKGTNGPELWSKILEKLPTGAIIAGGAVRDYLLGIEPKDIDIFIHDQDFPDIEGFNTLGDDRRKEYDAMTDISVVTHGVVAGYPADLVGIHNWNPAEFVNLFDFGLAQCWFDGEIHETFEAINDRANHTVTLLLTDRLERAKTRFERFNERMGGGWTLLVPEGVEL